jgi:hypothetical protein
MQTSQDQLQDDREAADGNTEYAWYNHQSTESLQYHLPPKQN